MKKINLGIVAIVLTVLVLVGYIVNDENEKTKDKVKIKDICIAYMEIHNKYSVLEEKYRNIDNNIPTDEYEKYLSAMKSELSEYVLEENLQDVYDKYKANLDKQKTGIYLVKKYDRQFKDISRYGFDLPLVTTNIDLIVNTEIEQRYTAIKDEKTNKYTGKVTLDTTTNRMNDTIIFKKVNGEYKIVYHNVSKMFSYSYEGRGGI